MSAKHTWTDDEDDFLRALCSEPLSFQEIADKMGRGRNAVIGRASRLGIKKLFNAPPVNKLTPEARRDRLREQAAKRAKRESRAVSINPTRNSGNGSPVMVVRHIEYPTAKSDLAIPASQRRGLTELRPGECHWPVGDVQEPGFFFCGGYALEGRPYCHGHTMRARG